MNLLFVMLAWAAVASPPAADNFGRPFPKWVPEDVRAFVIDAQACKHFSGEAGFDAERQAFLRKMIDETCPNLDRSKRQLNRRYARSAKIRQLIADVWPE